MSELHPALQRRWTDARSYRDDQVVRQEAKGHWHVESSAGGHYEVWIHLGKEGKLDFAKCNCPDYTYQQRQEQLRRAGIKWNGIVVCKHCLAAALKEKQLWCDIDVQFGRRFITYAITGPEVGVERELAELFRVYPATRYQTAVVSTKTLESGQHKLTVARSR